MTDFNSRKVRQISYTEVELDSVMIPESAREKSSASFNDLPRVTSRRTCALVNKTNLEIRAALAASEAPTARELRLLEPRLRSCTRRSLSSLRLHLGYI